MVYRIQHRPVLKIIRHPLLKNTEIDNRWSETGCLGSHFKDLVTPAEIGSMRSTVRQKCLGVSRHFTRGHRHRHTQAHRYKDTHTHTHIHTHTHAHTHRHKPRHTHTHRHTHAEKIRITVVFNPLSDLKKETGLQVYEVNGRKSIPEIHMCVISACV